MSSYIQVFGGNTIQTGAIPYLLINMTGNTTLSWPIQFQNTNLVVANNMDVNPNANGYTLFLPPAANTAPSTPQPYVPLGQAFQINNISAHNFTLSTNGGASTWTINAGTSWFFYLTVNSTLDGTWRQIPMAGGTTAVTSVAAASTSNNITITGSPITSAGTLTFGLANDLAVLSGFGASTGIPVRTAANTWALSQIVGTTNQIAVTNGSGVAGNPTISLASTITGINNLTVGTLNLASNTIQGANNTNLILQSNGTGLVEINTSGLRLDSGLPMYFYGTNNTNWIAFQGGNQTTNQTFTWPTAAPTNNQVLQFQGGTALGWTTITTFGGPSTINALARYSNVNGSLANSTVLLDGIGNLTGINSATIQSMTIGVSGASTIATTGNANLSLQPNGIGEVQVSGNVSILNGAALKIFDPVGGGSFYSSFQYPNTASANISYQLPITAPTVNGYGFQVLAQKAGQPSGTLTWSNAPGVNNLLINGGFYVWQRGTNFTNATSYVNNNNSYIADGWKLLSNGNNIVNVSRGVGINSAFGSSAYSCLMTVASANQKFGIIQYLDTITTNSLVTQSLSNYFISWGTGNINSVNVAILSWTGGVDIPTSNVVANWNASGINPTLAANWNYVGAVFSAPITGAVSGFMNAGITIPANAINLAIFIWYNGTNAAINDTLSLGCIKLEQGIQSSVYVERPFAQELYLAKYLFQKDFPYSVVPFSATTFSSVGKLIVSPINGATTIPNATDYAEINYEREMRITPTIVIYPFTTVTSRNIVSSNAGTDQAANTGSISYSDTRGFILNNNSGGNLVTTGYLLFHYTLDAGYNI